MIGREDELRRLVELASTPETAVAILAGEPGIGKTRLVHELVGSVPPETTVRSAALAASLAGDVGNDELVRDVVVGALLRHIGCTGFALEEAHRYGVGDDVSVLVLGPPRTVRVSGIVKFGETGSTGGAGFRPRARSG